VDYCLYKVVGRPGSLRGPQPPLGVALGILLNRTFLDLGYLVRQQTVRLAVYGLGRFLVGSFGEAEDLARIIVKPVLSVLDPVLWASATASAVKPSTPLWWSMNSGIVPVPFLPPYIWQDVRARRHFRLGWEANPSLEGRQVAILRQRERFTR
jgi:hypothetical protein